MSEPPTQNGIEADIHSLWQECVNSKERSGRTVDALQAKHPNDRVVNARAAEIHVHLNNLLRVADGCRYGVPSPGHQMQLRQVVTAMHAIETALGDQPPAVAQ